MAERISGQPDAEAAKEIRRKRLFQVGPEDLEPVTKLVLPAREAHLAAPARTHEWKHTKYNEVTGQLATTVLGRETVVEEPRELPEPNTTRHEPVLQHGTDLDALFASEQAKEKRYANPPMPDFSKGGHDPTRMDYPEGIDIPRGVNLEQLPPPQPTQAPGHEQQ